MVSRKELKQIEEDKAYWEVLTAYIPDWKLLGWTYRQGATFITKTTNPKWEETIQISNFQRDSLVKAFEEACENCL